MAEDGSRVLLDWTLGGLTILEIMRKMKTAEGRRTLSTKQQTMAESIRCNEILYGMIKEEL